MHGNERTQFVVIGLGRLGSTLAKQLFTMDKDVLAVDINEDRVNAIANEVTHAVAADVTDENVLGSLGIRNFDAAIICIGNMQASILATLLCKQAGVKYVVAKAQSEMHRTVLEKIGADQVFFPEEYMGKRMAFVLANPNLNDVIDLTDGFRIIFVKTPKKWIGHSLKELDLRRIYNVSVILVKRGDGTIITAPGGESILYADDSIMLGGEMELIDKFSNKFSAE